MGDLACYQKILSYNSKIRYPAITQVLGFRFIGDEYSNEFKLLLEECVAIKYAVLIQSWLQLRKYSVQL